MSKQTPQHNKRLPPLYRDAQRVLLVIEQQVRGFPRYHKYTIGTDLRTQAMQVMRAVHRATYARTLANVEHLLWQVEDLKLTLQLARNIGAYSNLRQFSQLAEQLVAMGKQCGGWKRSLQHQASASSTSPGQILD